MTTSSEFEASLHTDDPPHDLRPALAALWHAHRDHWDAAHALVQDEASREAAWVHAWLHRAEGDLGNAAYWYRRAGRTAGSGPLKSEWRTIADALLVEGDP